MSVKVEFLNPETREWTEEEPIKPGQSTVFSDLIPHLVFPRGVFIECAKDNSMSRVFSVSYRCSESGQASVIVDTSELKILGPGEQHSVRLQTGNKGGRTFCFTHLNEEDNLQK